MSDIEIIKPKRQLSEIINEYVFSDEEIKRLKYIYTKEWELYKKGIKALLEPEGVMSIDGIKLILSKITTNKPDNDYNYENILFSDEKQAIFAQWLFKSHLIALKDCDRKIGNRITHHLPIIFHLYINEERAKRLQDPSLDMSFKIDDFNKLTNVIIDEINNHLDEFFEVSVISPVTTEDSFEYIPVNLEMETIYQQSEDTYIKTFLNSLINKSSSEESFTRSEELFGLFGKKKKENKLEKSSENILEKIQIGFGAVLIAYCIYVFIIVPIYKHSPLYKYIENKRKEKEKEIEKQRQIDRKNEMNERDKLVQELKTNPQLKHLQSEIKRTVDLANSFGKSLVPVLRTELKKIDPKNYIKVFDCSSDNNVTDKMTDVLWDMCFEIAKAIQNKTDTDIFFECYSFGIDGLKQYTIDDDNNDSDNQKFDKVFESTVENHCKKLKIPRISIDDEVNGDCSYNTIYYNYDWGGDHHGTIQSLVNTIHLDFSK